jgi:phage gp29-like protein
MATKKPAADIAVKEDPLSLGLFNEQATSQLLRYLTRYPDFDEVLKKAGIRRRHLRTLLYDDEIAQAFDTRRDALLSVPMRLEPTEGADADKLRLILEPVLRDALTGMFNAVPFGYSVLEAVWERKDDGLIGLKTLGEKPFEWFEPKQDGTLVFYKDDGSGGVYGEEVDQKFKFFVTRSRATYANPYGEALLSRLYWAWYFRTNGWNFWAKFLERFGSPILVGKSSNNKAMLTALLQAHAQAAIAVSATDDVGTVGAATGNAGQAFEAFETNVIRRIQKVVLGQTLTSGTDGGSGNRALGQVHDAVRHDKRNSDISLIQYTMQRVVDAACTLNNLAPHKIVFADDTGLEKDRATRDKDLYAVGVRFEKTYFQDSYDLAEEDFTLSSEAAPVGGLPTPGQPVGGAVPKPGADEDPAAAGAADPKPPTKAAKLAASKFTNHGAGTKFTKQQDVVEALADASQVGAEAIPADKLRSAVLSATSPEDLADRLFALVGSSVSQSEFAVALERSLYAADILGYVHADGKV